MMLAPSRQAKSRAVASAVPMRMKLIRTLLRADSTCDWATPVLYSMHSLNRSMLSWTAESSRSRRRSLAASGLPSFRSSIVSRTTASSESRAVIEALKSCLSLSSRMSCGYSAHIASPSFTAASTTAPAVVHDLGSSKASSIARRTARAVTRFFCTMRLRLTTEGTEFVAMTTTFSLMSTTRHRLNAPSRVAIRKSVMNPTVIRRGMVQVLIGFLRTG